MTKKWVDNEVYFGPDRRSRDAGKRWGERRRYNDAAEPPPLGALLRRLRIMLTDATSPDRRLRALQLANLAIYEAEGMRLRDCANRIREAARLISANARDSTVAADALLVEAMELAQAPRLY